MNFPEMLQNNNSSRSVSLMAPVKTAEPNHPEPEAVLNLNKRPDSMKMKPLLTAIVLLLAVNLCSSIGSRTLFADEARGLSNTPAPLENAHAHNDYLHQRPLLDALDHGFTSIEADVFPVEGQLLVAHTFLELSKDKTLEGLYLMPLRNIAKRNGGSIYSDGKPIILLVDIKTKGVEAYALLEALLKSYDDVVSSHLDGQLREKAVTVIISGDRPRAEIEKSNPRYGAIDGRLGDLESTSTASLVPLISDNWGNHFKYRGKGEMPAAEREKLAAIVRKCHDQGRRLRFWATPENSTLWTELRNAGVDLIGTDDLKALQGHLQK
jgi:hypothetical protein